MFSYDETIKNMKTNTHNHEVLEYLNKYKDKGITSMDAFRELGVTRLAAVIHELKHVYNVPIKSERISYKAKNGRNTNFSRYYLNTND